MRKEHQVELPSHVDGVGDDHDGHDDGEDGVLQESRHSH